MRSPAPAKPREVRSPAPAKPREVPDRSGRWSGIMSAPVPGLLQPLNWSNRSKSPSCPKMDEVSNRVPSSQAPTLGSTRLGQITPAPRLNRFAPAARSPTAHFREARSPTAHFRELTKHQKAPDHFLPTSPQIATRSFQAPHFPA